MTDDEPIPGPPGLHQALLRNTGYLVSRMGAFAHKRFRELISSVGLTPPMWGVLNVLDAEHGMTQQQLGKAIGLDPSTMVSTIDELESRGLAERRPHPNDRRAHALQITDAGRATLARGRELARQGQEELLAPLSADERQQLHELLLRLAVAAAAIDAPAVTGTPPDRSPRGGR
jgi:DNA-binding MarR family transcriptional regulator